MPLLYFSFTLTFFLFRVPDREVVPRWKRRSKRFFTPFITIYTSGTVYFLFNDLLNNTQPRISCQRPALQLLSESPGRTWFPRIPRELREAAQTDLQNVDMNNATASCPLVVFMSNAHRDKHKLFRLFINELALVRYIAKLHASRWRTSCRDKTCHSLLCSSSPLPDLISR